MGRRSGIRPDARCVSTSRTVILREGADQWTAGADLHIVKFRQVFHRIVERELPLSARIATATAVTGLLIDAIQKMFVGSHLPARPRSDEPLRKDAERLALVARSVTTPAASPLSTNAAIAAGTVSNEPVDCAGSVGETPTTPPARGEQTKCNVRQRECENVGAGGDGDILATVHRVSHRRGFQVPASEMPEMRARLRIDSRDSPLA